MGLDADWRLNGQERYLDGATLFRRTYCTNPDNPDWDHDHCAFCNAKFMVEDIPGVLHQGYATADDYHWICDECFAEFKDRFRWVVQSVV